MGKTPEELLNELSEADAALLGEDCQALIRAIGLEGFKKADTGIFWSTAVYPQTGKSMPLSQG